MEREVSIRAAIISQKHSKKCCEHVLSWQIDKATGHFIEVPNQEEAMRIAELFQRTYKFPQVIECTDSPTDSYQDFINRRGWTSYVPQGVVDGQYWDMYLSLYCLPNKWASFPPYFNTINSRAVNYQPTQLKKEIRCNIDKKQTCNWKQLSPLSANCNKCDMQCWRYIPESWQRGLIINFSTSVPIDGDHFWLVWIARHLTASRSQLQQ